MSPDLDDDPSTALSASLSFLDSLTSGYSIEGNIITIHEPALRYVWFLLDGDFTWRLLDAETKSNLTVSHNFPVKCELRSADKGQGIRRPRLKTIIIPERESGFHLFAELAGPPVEGQILSVDTLLSARVAWYSGPSVVAEDTLVYSIPTSTAGSVIECRVRPRDDVAATVLQTAPIAASDLRFASPQMKDDMHEGDELGFTVRTSGVARVRVLRSCEAGEWEEAATLAADKRNKAGDAVRVVREKGVLELGIAVVLGNLGRGWHEELRWGDPKNSEGGEGGGIGKLGQFGGIVIVDRDVARLSGVIGLDGKGWGIVFCIVRCR
jgi:hypothetical protein